SALKLDPANVSARIGLGNIYIKTERIQQAVDILEKAAASGTSFEAPFLLGSAYSKLGRNEDAVSAFYAALRLDSKQAEVYYQLAMVLSKLDRKTEREKALQKF